MTIERRMEADRNFPRPILLGPGARVRLWDEQAIEAYERASVVAR
jgi:predicted DNA-binding transcriptional regulator AlpA